MPYEPLHHKYRPKCFAELVGQEAIATTLTNAIRTAKIAPAYLFTGPRGTGKTSSARILAKSLNCLKSDKPTPEPCGVCDVCQGITKGYSLDVIEIDAASNTGVDNIRELIEKAQFAPVQCRYKVYVVDECHMLSNQAFNALLKTLEEPPKHVVFVLATTDPQRVLPTIISRCQRFDFRRIQLEAMVKHLTAIAMKESIDISDEAITLVAQIAQGGLRDAESLLDQLALLAGEVTPDRVWDLVGSVSERDLLALLNAIAQDSPEAVLDCSRYILERGREPLTILQNLANLYRDLLIAKTAPSRQDLVACTSPTWTALVELAQQLPISTILAGQQHLRTAELQLKNTTQPRLWLEVTLLGLLPSASITQPTAIVLPRQPIPQNNHHPSPPPLASVLPPTNHHQSPPPPPQATAAPVTALQQPVSPPLPASTPPPVQPTEPTQTVPPAIATPPTTGELEINDLWQQVLNNIQQIPRRALLGQMCHLIEFNGATARVGVKQAWYDKVKSDVTMIAAAFQQTVNRQVEVSLEKANIANSTVVKKEPSTNGANRIQQSPAVKYEQKSSAPQPVTPTPISQPTITPAPVKSEAPVNHYHNGHNNGIARIETSPPQPTQSSSEEWDEVTRAAQHLAQFFDGQIIRFAEDNADLSSSTAATDWVEEVEVDD
ncbi:DNA polymerase III subunit gamma/tau [Nostoc sp. FACHB-110]|uniref:DNA polymerase III subunit gamma/tau n=1 Tax=Nostoc sp. FACHB-110 TaxID=2692834 RepID=UPI001683E40F|nr:DNA polymerase III subunit gamma/tau [Nostoc sp. FACHB-110]MBD2435254.1 DNA polymerase III subunit gamma/tau [Nostoc sp. FACHB-110]